MSGGLAPSKTTVYVSNLPFSLTNNDMHKIFEKHGKVVKVTIMSDKFTRKSKGVAFVLFLEKEAAHKCVHAMNGTQLFGRTIRCSIAKDNGRAADFIRRREYKDKSRCYQCGEFEHLSYNCPNNILGDREPPPKKEKKKRQFTEPEPEPEVSDESDIGEDPREDSLAAAIKYQQNKIEAEEYQARGVAATYTAGTSGEPKKKKYKTDAYFSDEEELDD